MQSLSTIASLLHVQVLSVGVLSSMCFHVFITLRLGVYLHDEVISINSALLQKQNKIKHPHTHPHIHEHPHTHTLLQMKFQYAVIKTIKISSRIFFSVNILT